MRAELISQMDSHRCAYCNDCLAIFSLVLPIMKKQRAPAKVECNEVRRKIYHQKKDKGEIMVASLPEEISTSLFPHLCELLSPDLSMRIIKDFCRDQALESFKECWLHYMQPAHAAV